jgi:hypothetical protein
MIDNVQPDANAHDAPLVELVARLGAGRSLRERVVALRYKRRRKSLTNPTSSDLLVNECNEQQIEPTQES